jgi:hypothetical protein
MQFLLPKCNFTTKKNFYFGNVVLLQEMNCICNNFIFIIVNKISMKFSFLRNVLQKSTSHLDSPSSPYTIGGDQCMKKLALGH